MLFRLLNGSIEFATDRTGFVFASEKELNKLAVTLELSRKDLEGIWNRAAGKPPYEELKPVKKFRNRPYGVKQIWKVIQRLVPKKPNPANSTIKVTKSALVISMLKAPKGASSIELMEATGWKPHTVRGFVSTLQSKHGLKVEGTRANKGMVYRIPA